MSGTSTVSATLEDYLEAILKLDADKGAARVRDIAGELSVHKSTVSTALKSLSAKGLIEHRPYEITQLTAKGREIAERVSRNHEAIRDFLTDVLLVDGETAGANACRMEHVMDRRVLGRLALFARFAREGDRGRESWLAQFKRLVERERRDDSEE